MDLKIIELVISATIPILIFYFGNRLEKRQRQVVEAQQKERDKLERRHSPRIQLELDARVFAPQRGYHIVHLLVILNNQGFIRQIVNKISLKVSGIQDDSDIGLFTKYAKKEHLDAVAAFPRNLINTHIPLKGDENDDNRFFIEPGIEQRFSYVARIPEHIRFILVRANFEYHKKSKHSAEQVFDLQAFTNTPH